MDQTLCAICCEQKRSLYNVKCPNCLECGYANKLTCNDCLNKIDTCPWCRCEINPNLLQLKTWRTAPKISRVVARMPEKGKQMVSKFSKTKIFPTSSNVAVEKKTSCFDICMWIKFILNCFFMLVGISVTGFLMGMIWCGKPNCVYCIINGILGVCYATTASMAITIALHGVRSESKYRFLTISHLSCTFFFASMMFITFGTLGSCSLVITNCIILLFLLPCYFCLTVKCVADCASLSDG
jgi:hypothetical protein